MSAIMQGTNYTMNEGWKDYVKGKTSLELGNSNLEDKDILELAEVLKENKTIKFIDLSNNKITAVGATALANTLRVNIYIAKNPIVGTGALDLSGNNLGKEGIAAIIKAFAETDRFLHCVDFGVLNISEKDEEELSKMAEFIKIKKSTDEFRKVIDRKI